MKIHTLYFALLFTLFTGSLFSVTAQDRETPSPALLVGEKDGALLAIVDPYTLEVVARIPANPNPHEVTTDGQYAYISNSGASAITVIDLTAQELVEGIDLQPLSPIHGLEVAGGYLYFANENSRTLGRYNLETREIDWVFGTGLEQSHMLVVNEDGSKLFTTNMAPGTASIIERTASGGRAIRTVYTGNRAEGLGLSPNGEEFWVSNVHDATITIIDVDSWEITGTIDLPTTFSNRLRFSPNGQFVIVADLQGDDILIIDTDSRTIVKQIDVGGGSEGLMFSPDGSRAFIAVSMANKVAAIDMETLTVAGEIHGFSNPDGLAWAVAP
ncbi:MAG: hypothetical protein WD355_05975 [Balneolaceae bacterium]